MPVKNGYDACRDIRSWETRNNHPHVPIIALSANVMAEGRLASADAGFTQYTTKPIDLQALGNLLVELLEPGKQHVFLRDSL